MGWKVRARGWEGKGEGVRKSSRERRWGVECASEDALEENQW